MGVPEMPTEIELDIFSGRSNPTWILEASLEAELVNRLRGLPPAHRQAPEPPGLGYRGLLIHSAPELGSGHPIRVYKGVLKHPDGLREDSQRELEAWLLKTGTPFLESNLMEAAAGELDRS